jgi:hypothetical protein
MKGASNLVAAIQSIRVAYNNFENFQIEHPDTKGAVLFNSYNKKLEWIYKDFKATTLLPEDIRKAIQEEWESDVLIVPDITEKVTLLNPSQRELVDAMIDAMLKGEEIKFG